MVYDGEHRRRVTVYAMHIEHQSPDQQTTTRLDPKRKRFGPPEPLYEVFRNRSETFHFYSFRTRNVPGPFLPISDPFRNISVTCLVEMMLSVHARCMVAGQPLCGTCRRPIPVMLTGFA